MKYFLGLTYSGMHDSNVAVVGEDGDVALAVNEERLTGWKKDGRWPSNGVRLAKDFLKKNNATCAGICVPFMDPAERIKESGARVYTGTCSSFRRDQLRKPGYGKYSESWTRRIQSILPASPLYFMGHHRSHAALAFFQSGFERAHIVTADGGCFNEPWHLTVWHGEGLHLQPLTMLSHNRYISLARFYANVTALLGFRGNEDEGKITGLSAFGVVTKACISALECLLNDPDLGLLNYWINILDDSAHPQYLTNSFVAQRLRQRYLSSFLREDVAASLQFLIERSLQQVLQEVVSPSPRIPLVLAGGLFANVKLNASLRGKGDSKIFVAPAMGDDGLSIGAVLGKLAKEERVPMTFIKTLYRGPIFDSDACLNLLKRKGIVSRSFSSETDITTTVAQLLSRKKIIAICRGRMEYGPRALGNRSILACVTDRKISHELNRRLARTDFMPFAPVVRKEDGERCFDRLRGAERAMPFMTIALPCTNWFRRICPAVVHVDGTARPQVVDSEANPFLHELLTRYMEETGVPALMNTSFNLHGEPIVCFPEDALRAFFVAGLDYLVLGDSLISLRQNKHIARKYTELQRIRILKRQKEKNDGLISGMEKKIYESVEHSFFD